MRKLIAAMKISIDGKMAGPDGLADWVEGWSDDYGLMAEADACLLGGGMYPGYERYWTMLRDEPEAPVPMTGKPPTAAEVEYARFTARTPHYVLSNTLEAASWPNTHIVRSLEEVAALKAQPGRAIYLVGGGRTAGSLIDAGLVDELRLIVYPLIAGKGQALFATEQRRGFALRRAETLPDGRVALACAFG